MSTRSALEQTILHFPRSFRMFNRLSKASKVRVSVVTCLTNFMTLSDLQNVLGKNVN